MKTFWTGRRVLVTGHTGFKGAWLCLWLERLGATVRGVALQAHTTPALSSLLTWGPDVSSEILDIRNAPALARAVEEARPEIVFHLAAQALVRRSYDDPTETFATNVLGTVNLLSALRNSPDFKAGVIVTTDKVYENDNRGIPFAEDDRLGGKDPYSASKACAELVSRSFRSSFFGAGQALASARAGNVVGGGDWAVDRLVPDFVRALVAGEPLVLRNPDAVRPWQHVLEPLAGYLMLAQALIERPHMTPESLNFGPDPDNFAPVRQVAQVLGTAFGVDTDWRRSSGSHPPEAALLTLRSDLASRTLGWRPKLALGETLDWTAAWYRAHADGRDMRAFSLAQIAAYEQRAASEEIAA